MVFEQVTIHHYELKFRLQRIKWLKKTPNHAIYNSLPLSSFHISSPERRAILWITGTTTGFGLYLIGAVLNGRGDESSI